MNSGKGREGKRDRKAQTPDQNPAVGGGIEFGWQLVVLAPAIPFQFSEIEVNVWNSRFVGVARDHPDIEVRPVLDVGVVLEAKNVLPFVLVDGGGTCGAVIDTSEITADENNGTRT